MDSIKVAKTFKGKVYEGKDHFLLEQQDPNKAQETIQSFVDRMLMEYEGQSVTVKLTIDIDMV